MVPNVNVSVLWAKHSHIGVASYHQNLSTTHLFTPSGFVSLGINDPQFSFVGSKHQIGELVVNEVITRGNLGNLFVFILSFDKNIIILQFFVFFKAPKVHLVSSNCRKLKQIALSSRFMDTYVIKFIKGITWSFKFAEREIPNANGAFSEIANGNNEFAIITEFDRLNASGMEL